MPGGVVVSGRQRRALFVLAHPDDESMGNGCTIQRHTAAGVAVHLLCLTRGGAGWGGLPAGRRAEELPDIRSEELRRASQRLGLASLQICDYPDGGVPDCDQEELRDRIAGTIQSLQPDLVVGWGPDGGYGHPDHVAVGAATDRAVALVAPALPLYHMAVNARMAADYGRAFELAGAGADSLPLRISETVSLLLVPTEEELTAKGEAVSCHESQLRRWLLNLLADRSTLRLFGSEAYIRVGSEGSERVMASGGFPELEG
ncbi:PIG-L family deacetylase [Candidatus Nephthysia bennettiae]|uniref:PIG-L family deacetylase n=1 Tax=Candidatus Nephthysia bennettiae TaxID=3127016 RepID=A0A934KAG7_9BACT|nr:PIG-L family deacetylase [Candidatus Dormibacteraeota bacterium]